MVYFSLVEHPEIEGVDLIIPHWTLRGVSLTLRLSLVQGSSGNFSIATPGRGGHFNNSYSYELVLPLRGSGPAAIRKAIEGKSYGMREFRCHPTMLRITAEAINAGRKVLIKQKKRGTHELFN